MARRRVSVRHLVTAQAEVGLALLEQLIVDRAMRGMADGAILGNGRMFLPEGSGFL